MDEHYEFGKYILTGSSTPADKADVHHSGAGRITPVRMRPMTLWESSDAKGAISFADLFAGRDVVGAKSNLSFDDVAELT